MLLYLYRLLFGYLYVRVKSPTPEKLLNICAAKGITIWRVSLKKDKLYFKIGISSFKRLRLFKRNVSGKIHITKKVGLPFFISKNRKRYGIVVGMILFFVILNFMSGYVWNICVSGNSDIKSSEIISSLKEIGIYEGAKISDIDPAQNRNELLLKQDGISWAAINIEGSKITVDITESKIGEEKDISPSNLKAKCEGVIKKIEVISGTTKVKVGDAVEKGQLLVSGLKEYNDLSSDFVRARGKIYAETGKTITIAQPLKVTEYLETGEKISLSAIKIFGFEIPLFLGRIDGEYRASNYETEVSSGEPYLPIERIERDFFKLEKTTFILTENEARKRAEANAERIVDEWVAGGEITYKKDSVAVENGVLVLKIEIKCIKDIALEEKIHLDTRNYEEDMLK